MPLPCTKVKPLRIDDVYIRVAYGRHFEARTRLEPEITSLNPARHIFMKPDLRPKAKFTE